MKNIKFCSDIDTMENDSTEFFNLVLFDLDGTLIDSGRGIMLALDYAFHMLGESTPKMEELRRFIGPPLLWSFENICGYDREKALRGVKLYREYYPRHGIFEFDIYPGVRELISHMKAQGTKIYLATSKPEIFAKDIIEHMGLGDYFDGIVGSDMDNSKADKAVIVEIALEKGRKQIENEFGEGAVVNPLMVGDRKFDIIGAHMNNIKCVAVDNGYGSIDEYVENGADFIFDSMHDDRWYEGCEW